MDVKVGVNVNLTAGRSVVMSGACLVDLIGYRATDRAAQCVSRRQRPVLHSPDPTADAVILYGRRHRLPALVSF